jgi:hypothetical protein
MAQGSACFVLGNGMYGDGIHLPTRHKRRPPLYTFFYHTVYNGSAACISAGFWLIAPLNADRVGYLTQVTICRPPVYGARPQIIRFAECSSRQVFSLS